MKYFLSAILILLCLSCESKKDKIDTASETTRRNSVYYWKTVFYIDSTGMSFLQKHNIERIYLRMFDVATEQNLQTGSKDIVPIATTKFVSSVPNSVEVVPVTYITIEALRAMEGSEHEFASLIVERTLAMSSYNECGKIKEMQLDCDWTSSTKNSYNLLCQTVKDSLQVKNIALSVTVRLHQLRESAPPVDRGVLMLYNTGALKNPETKNSIMDINDAKPYIKETRYPIPLDYAYPAFGWGVKFDNNKFVSIVAESATANAGEHIRHERPAVAEILAVKELVEQNLGKPSSGNILYHLDNSQLKNYADDEINQILSY